MGEGWGGGRGRVENARYSSTPAFPSPPRPPWAEAEDGGDLRVLCRRRRSEAGPPARACSSSGPGFAGTFEFGTRSLFAFYVKHVGSMDLKLE